MSPVIQCVKYEINVLWRVFWNAIFKTLDQNPSEKNRGNTRRKVLTLPLASFFKVKCMPIWHKLQFNNHENGYQQRWTQLIDFDN